ncbi:filamentous haemagglutinin family protein [Alcaligenes aquatilis]|uniref:Filamentous hemagglutinin N-terminal domain-containing protein n=1 Tax=Alcaligenes aquatilis TaxID=323284 RepID=A0A3G2HQV8_9BURK|nr:filamentous haemagglutinin family protein [Alcaligenes aquatilis]AYN19510.1 filamentous hemagglutinin N-terminal domain-containing protein [Alcaligenes aquatilis]
MKQLRKRDIHSSSIPGRMRLAPLAEALVVALLASTAVSAYAQTPLTSSWIATPQGGGGNRAARAAARPGADASLESVTIRQQQAARQKLQRSVANLERTASAIAAQQAAQRAARVQAQGATSDVPNGLVQGGLWDRDADGNLLQWTGAERAVQTVEDGKTTVAVKQTQSKAILNWDTFNVGRETTVDFQQGTSDAVLNRVVGADTRPSQIQGAIKGDGTVMVVNQNGVIFSGSSQVNTRNLVVAAANITDPQFNNGFYNGSNPTFTGAAGQIEVQRGAQIETKKASASSTIGGGYVLLLGKQVVNAGNLSAPNGQVVLAAGDSFVIRKGYGTEGNQTSTTRGNEVVAGGTGKVINTGLIQAKTGDVTLTAAEVRQEGMALVTTSVDVRGTVHLNAAGADGKVVLGKDATTAIVLEDTDTTALDGQRDSLQTPVVDTTDDNIVAADPYRRDLSLVEIKSGGTVDFEGDSLTLASGGQIVVDAGARALVRDGALLDVSGAIGVRVAMEDNSLNIWVQGSEQRDAPINRDAGALNSNELWIDRRSLIYVAAGTNGYASDRWYTAGGLLEVGGYLATTGRNIGEWMAQGGTVSFTGSEVVTQTGSSINLSGGTLDVQSGYIRQSWLKGADGRLYEVSSAPGDLLYKGLYQGYEASSERWNQTDYYVTPLIGASRRYEPGYTVGRDAGTLVIGTRNAVLEGSIVGDTFQGDRQTQSAQAGLDGFYQSQRAVARGGNLVVGSYTPWYVKDSGTLQYGLTSTANTLQDVIFSKTAENIAAGLDLDTALPEDRAGTLYLDTAMIDDAGLGGVRIAARNRVAVNDDLSVSHGGEITLYSQTVDVNANVINHGGSIRLGNVLHQISSNRRFEDTTLGSAAEASVTVAPGAAVDASGLWSNLLLDPSNIANLPYQNGGSVSIRSSGEVTLEQGSLIDVSSGAAILTNETVQGGRGGNVTLAANANTALASGALNLDGDIRGFGIAGGGLLDILAGTVKIGGAKDGGEPGELHLEEDFFQKGFSRYAVTGNRGLEVAEGAYVDITMPVYQLAASLRSTPTATGSQGALEVWTPPLYQEDPVAGVLTQRRGASLSLQAGTALTSFSDRANVQSEVGRGAFVTVDPGRSIELRSVGQLTMHGTLKAQGGHIELNDVEGLPDDAGHGRSIWIGEDALLDVSGTAAVAVDQAGRRYGSVNAGGSIVIGGAFDSGEVESDAADLFVVLREGAVLDASGASAVLDVPGRGATEIGGAGGSITLTSSNGLYLDGTLRAESGGAGAAGGSLTVALNTPIYDDDAGQRVRQARELQVSEQRPRPTLADGLTPATADEQLVYGQAVLSAGQLASGGFDSLTLASDGALSFAGDLSLTADYALSLYARVIGLAEGAAENSKVHFAAPYVRLSSYGGTLGGDNQVHPTIVAGPDSVSQSAPAGTLIVEANRLLDVGGLNSGGRSATGAGTGLAAGIDRRGFNEVVFSSGGDLRLLGGSFYTSGDLTLEAAQVYPITGVSAELYAGWQGPNSSYAPGRVLTVARTTEDAPALPYSVFGSLSLYAATIDQGGVLRAPLGHLTLGESWTPRVTQTVNLLPGSLTSVSANGLVMPYGGTRDGITWTYDGTEISLIGTGTAKDSHVKLVGQYVDVGNGSVIDLSGGGELAGAGFVSGRGGSTDARYNPLVQVNRDGFTLAGLDTNPVYAIVPGVQAVAAPARGETGASDPVIGQQITIGKGVSGLAAGTYTLLPSTYALMPGAYRVEINGSAGAVSAGSITTTALRNGSYSVGGLISVAGTDLAEKLPRQVIVTSADTLRRYSQYNETSYADFVRADAATLGIPRAVLEADAKNLWLQLLARDGNEDALSLAFDGMVRGDAAEGGRGSTLSLIGSSEGARIEVLGDTGSPDAAYQISVRASDLSKVQVDRLAIGGVPWVLYGQGGNLVRFGSEASGAGVRPVNGVTIRSGAVLAAPEVMLITLGTPKDLEQGAIVIEQGATISALGQGAPAYDSDDGFIYQPERQSVVAVSNGRLQWLAPESDRNLGPGPIRVGTCIFADCTGSTQIYSEGSIGFVTNNAFDLDDAVRYGTRHLSLAVGVFNVGSQQALSDATVRGALTPGLALDQQILERLLQGDASTGAPALETLELIAGQSLNFFDSVTLSTLDADGNSLLDNLMLTAPAIYGYGGAEDVARIQTGHLIWNGSDQQPGAIASAGAGTGSGTLLAEAEQITFGYGSWGQPDGVSELDRLALGFSMVDLRASERISANNAGTLAVYQSQGEYVSGEGYRYSGGNLNVVTPLWTGEAGSVSRITAGGSIAVAAPESGGVDPADVSALGAELLLTAGTGLSVDTTVALPSGKATLAATGDLTLGGRSRVDLSGRAVEFFDDEDATQYSWGGEAIFKSAQGNIRQAAGSVIDLTAQYNQAGRLTAIALGQGAGTVDLQGRIVASASGYYETGGTYVPYLSGGLLVQAQNLGGELSEAFASLNERLNEGSVYGLRAFQLKRGDLTIGDGLRANQIEVSVDGGHLTVAGAVDASGAQVGTIRLAGKNGLTVAGSAVLDAHGRLLRLDSYGQIIEAPNRAVVELYSGDGLLTLAEGARIDLRYGTDDARVTANPALHDGRLLGTVELFAPRIDANGESNTEAAAQYGDVAIDARGAIQVDGARLIALNAVQRYDDAPYAYVKDDEGNVVMDPETGRPQLDLSASGRPYQVVDQRYLGYRDEDGNWAGGKHFDSMAFVNSALDNNELLDDKLAGLNNDTYRNAFHLRPGVEIVSATEDGDIVVSGDVDLSGYRYASLNPNSQLTAVYGTGEPGTLAIRAGGDLSIYGSVNDGFAPQSETPDDNGWVLTPGMQPYGGDVVVPGPGVELGDGTRFPPGKVLNYDLPIQAVTLASGTELPVTAVLAGELNLPVGTVLRAAVRDAAGNVLYAAGTVLSQAVTLESGSRLEAGFRLPSATSLAAMTWPAGVSLPNRATSNPNTNPDGVFLAGTLELPVGALIPSMTDVKLVGDVPSVPLRSVSGESMGRNWAVAAMLPEGSLSWSMRLVAGADLDAADPRLTRPGASGKLVLADTHYSVYSQYERTVIPGTPPQPGGAWYWNELGEIFGFEPGTPVTEEWQSLCADGYCVRVNYIWNELGEIFGFQPGTPVPPEWESLCADGYCISLGEPIPGTPDQVVIGDVIKTIPVAQNFSVLRTGTGDLDLIASGDVAMQSLYGVYTAGMSTASRAGSQSDAFNMERTKQTDGTHLGTSFTPELPEGVEPSGPLYEALVNGGADSTYSAWYPDGGGNLLVRAGGNLTGDTAARYSPAFPNEDLRPQRSSADLGNWLWRQGSGDTTGIESIATSWWINFGTYVPGLAPTNSNYGLSSADRNAVAATPELVGFTGLGTLGGGNLSIQVGGNAGLINRRGSSVFITGGRQRSEGLIVAVGSTGRVLDSGELLLTGGGDLRFDIGGSLNPGLSARADLNSANGVNAAADYSSQNLDLNGILANLRGALAVSAGEIGGIGLNYFSSSANQVDARESRAYDPYSAALGTATGGPVLMLGDSSAMLATRGDLVVSGTSDPGRVALPDSLSYLAAGASEPASGGLSWFSLWTDNSAISLMSGGGDLTPSVQLREVYRGDALLGKNYSATDGRFIWPGQLRLIATSGSVYVGKSALGRATATQFNTAYSILLAPSEQGSLEILADDSIYGGGYAISRSAASSNAVPTPFDPAFGVFNSGSTLTSVHNLAADSIRPVSNRLPLFSFGPNTASTLPDNSQTPVRIYANAGDIIGLGTGEILTFVTGGRAGQTWYEGLGPVWMRAGRDIVRSGSLLDSTTVAPTEIGRTPSNAALQQRITSTGNLLIHSNQNDVSVIEAGRDILLSNFSVAGPGTLEISAGRNIVMAGQVEGGGYGETRIRSLGPIITGDGRLGADVMVHAGLGETGADYAGVLDLYLDPENLADSETPLADQQGKVVKVYDSELVEWLGDRYGFVPSSDEVASEEARALFASLPGEQQRIFARFVYFAELREGGREFNDPDGPRTGSYLRGRNAIAALFPEEDVQGDAIAYAGDLRMYGGAGVHTEVGGSIQVLTPGGGQTYGIEGEAPPATAGLITRGQGDIQLYSRESILLGQSRIMTTFGGSILGWSAQGDINAGRGSRTTVVYTPPLRTYDAYGNVMLSPAVPSTGAGIATLNPIPEVEPGDIDLIAPLGTIDAGEAGIRVSGNINLAALQVVNAANIQVQGESTGIPVIAAVNVSALSSASAAASSATQAAEDVMRQQQASARQNQPSMISVQILGFGDESL